MNSSPSAVLACAQSLHQLTQHIIAFQQDKRGAVMQSAVGFRPERSLAESFEAGPLRAAFASFWESATGSPVPIQELRAALDPPIPIRTVLAFSRLTIAGSHEETEEAVWHLVTHLQSRLRELRPRRLLANLFAGVSVSSARPQPVLSRSACRFLRGLTRRLRRLRGFSGFFICHVGDLL